VKMDHALYTRLATGSVSGASITLSSQEAAAILEDLRTLKAERHYQVSHHPGTEPTGHSITECRQRGCRP